MNNLLAQQLDDLLSGPTNAPRRACEGQLRVAAATLIHAARDEVVATTTAGGLAADDVAAFEALVGEISAEFGVLAAVSLRPGTFTVRFTRALETQPTVAARSTVLRSLLRGLLRGFRASTSAQT